MQVTTAMVSAGLERLGVGPATMDGVTVSRGRYGRVRWRCPTCRTSGAVAGCQDMVPLALASFVRKHGECADDGWR